MRIVIDLQGAQTRDSRGRGIGRYSRALAHGIIRNRGSHDVLLALNGAFPETLESIRSEFRGVLDPSAIRVWTPLERVNFAVQSNDSRRAASEAYRESFLSALNPDVVHVSSLFEGFGDDAVLTVGGLTDKVPTTVTLYDLIPFIYPETYFKNQRFEQWYRNRLGQLLRADRVLAISESSRKEVIDFLQFDAAKVIAVGTAADPQFRPVHLNGRELKKRQKNVGLTRPFVLYTGGIEQRKNIETLIRAYAGLPRPIRKTHQLAIVCSIHEADRSRLHSLGKDCGLTDAELVLTGFVPESDLLALYSSCELFVFPSRHEGFGLPVLEAMCCGAPVIASGSSSLPEVVGLQEALFDPFDERAITATIEKGLTDEEYRSRLKSNGVARCSEFSWDKTATLAIAAMEQAVAKPSIPFRRSSLTRPRMAYLSPLPPERSGIADYSEELLPYLSRYYDIDVIVQNGDAPIDDQFVRGSLGIVPSNEFRERYLDYDRFLYHFGNSPYHEHMFDHLNVTGGVVVLHDFYLSGIVGHRQRNADAPGFLQRELYHSHGYPALKFQAEADVEFEVDWKYPCSGSVVDSAHRVIVHSQNSVQLAQRWYSDEISRKFSVIPLLRVPDAKAIGKSETRLNLGYEPDDFIVCSFGLLGPTKLNHRLIEAWHATGFSNDPACKLVFVGENDPGPYGRELLHAIEELGLENVCVTGWIDRETYGRYLEAADVAVQLRTRSRGETSRATLDCLSVGTSLVVNANGAMAELPNQIVKILPDHFETAELVNALKNLRSNPKRRKKTADRAISFMRSRHAPELCAERYHEAVERAYDEVRSADKFVENVRRASLDNWSAASLADRWDQQRSGGRSRLFIDATYLAKFDARSGIQRVVRSLLKEFFNRDSAIKVEPVYYCSDTNRFRYARRFVSRFLEVDVGGLEDEIADIRFGDFFLGLDLNSSDVGQMSAYLGDLRLSGVHVSFVVYDLLPVRLPDCFVDGAETGHRRWADMVLESDMAICISEAVADDLRAYARETGAETKTEITVFPLGADFHLYPDDRGLLGAGGTEVGETPSFLMVGTLEPRKAHALVLDAFEKLWADGKDVQLCIVGKQGWMVEEVINRIRSISSTQPRLKWLDNADDQALAYLYRDAVCLIAASRDEGFGLPIIEAAHRGLPVIARDIPVFREVGGNWTSYFPKNASGADLAKHIWAWLERLRADDLPKADEPNLVSWKESADALLQLLERSRPTSQFKTC